MSLPIRLKVIFRSWKQNKQFAISVLASLIIGFTCCNLLTAFVINELKISEASPEKDQIFILKSDNPMTLETTKEQTSYIIGTVPPMLKDRYPEVEGFCRFQEPRNLTFEKDEFKSNAPVLLRCDCNIGKFMNIPVVQGNLFQTLSNPGEVAITTQLAQQVFGTTNVVGSTFYTTEEGRKTARKITTVVDNSFTSSFLNFDILLPLDEKQYHGGVTFIKLQSASDREPLLAKIENDLSILPKFTDECGYYLQSFSDFYFDTSTQTTWSFLLKRDRLFLYIGIVSAIAILLIACFNFINLYLIRLYKSNASNSIHKLLGASTLYLQKQLLLEAFLNTSIGFCLSLLFVVVLVPYFNNLFDAHLTTAFLLDKTVLGFFVLIIALLTLFPSFYLGAKFNNFAKSNRNRINSTFSKDRFSSAMIVLQFSFSILLIIAASVYNKQLYYITETSNINPNIIEIDGANLSTSEFMSFREEADKISTTEASTTSSTSFLNAWIKLGENNISVLEYAMDRNFSEVHNINLKEGKGFAQQNQSGITQVIVNETYYKILGSKIPLGSTYSESNEEYQLVGVVSDFHTGPFTEKVTPTKITLFEMTDKTQFKRLQLKTVEGRRSDALENLKKLWGEKFPEIEFSYSFIADNYQLYNKKYRRLAKMVSMFTIISFFLTGIGLLGVTRYSVESRTKEIGIRKVNGATATEVLSLLNKNFVTLVVIAYAVACPIAYYITNRWLENFAYKTELSWWLFGLAGVVALGIGIVTVSCQSWRTANSNPVEALKYE